MPSRSIGSPSRNLQNFLYALFCNRDLSATVILKLPVKRNLLFYRIPNLPSHIHTIPLRSRTENNYCY